MHVHTPMCVDDKQFIFPFHAGKNYINFNILQRIFHISFIFCWKKRLSKTIIISRPSPPPPPFLIFIAFDITIIFFLSNNDQNTIYLWLSLAVIRIFIFLPLTSNLVPSPGNSLSMVSAVCLLMTVVPVPRLRPLFAADLQHN